VRPYYLYHADEVKGTEHLRTPVETGIQIMEGLRGHTSGLGVPTFVVDVPGGGGKIPVSPNYILSWSEDEIVLRNYEWKTFHYRNPRPNKLRAAKAQKPVSSPVEVPVLVSNGSNGKTPAKHNSRAHKTAQQW